MDQVKQMERDYKKFFTPSHIAKYMVELLNPQAGDVVLEPSAGNGSIVKVIKEKEEKCIVFAFEINKEYEQDLRDAGANIVVIKDFLETPSRVQFTSCCANPPFDKNTNLQGHFDLMCELVKEGGKIIMVLPQDFKLKIEHETHSIENWSTNKDGTITPIKIVEFTNGKKA